MALCSCDPLVVLSESSALDVGEDVGKRLSELAGAFDHIDVVTALFTLEVEVEGRCKRLSERTPGGSSVGNSISNPPVG